MEAHVTSNLNRFELQRQIIHDEKLKSKLKKAPLKSVNLKYLLMTLTHCTHMQTWRKCSVTVDCSLVNGEFGCCGLYWTPCCLGSRLIIVACCRNVGDWLELNMWGCSLGTDSCWVTKIIGCWPEKGWAVIISWKSEYINLWNLSSIQIGDND